jgi:type II secretory pathway component PulK
MRTAIVRNSKRRRGVVIVMVLLILMIMSGLVAQFFRRAITDRRQTRNELQHQQAIQLSLAAEQLLAERLAADASYQGETWDHPAGILHKTNTASVVISITDTATDDRVATLTVRYPANADLPFKVTRTVRLLP